MSKKDENDNFMNYVEQRLDKWARWYRNTNNYGLGFRSETIEYVLMTVGIMAKSTGPKPLLCNEEAEEIEYLVNEMATHSEENEKMARALRIKYFGKKKSKEYSKEIGLGPSQFNVYVLMAKQWLVGRLSG